MAIDLNLIIDNAPEAIILIDGDGFIQYANSAVQSITGFSASEITGRHIFKSDFNREQSTTNEFEFGIARKRGKHISEGWKIRKNGQKYWGELTISPLPSKEEKGFICILRDQTERKSDELTLRENEELYRLMIEGVKDHVFYMLDPSGIIMTWNEGGQRIKGYSPSEVIGKHFSLFYTAEDLGKKVPEMELTMARKQGKYEQEGWRIRKNGSVFWANIIITPMYDTANRLIGFSKVTRDLSERRANEEAIRQSEQRYRLLVEQVTDYGIFMLDEKGRIVSWNEGAKRINGYTAEEIIGKYFSIFYPEEDIIKGKPANELKIARAEGKYEEEGWRVKKDGSVFWANVIITAVYNEVGHLVGFSKVTRDLTERKANEKALKESNERYRILTSQLEKSNENLKYVNSELEQFTSIVSHDLQEPVRTIKSFVSLAEIKLNERSFDEVEVCLSKCTAAANRMKELIRNLLNYSQLSNGELIQRRIVIADLIDHAIQNLKSSIEASNAKITIDNQSDTVAYGDPVQLVQVIQNLLSNSLKFNDKKNPEIRIFCRAEDGEVKFSVSDNGIGIPVSEAHKVFEIFKRLDTKENYPGTGIGLAICKKIIDRHKGKIWVEPTEKGTTFTFTIQDKTYSLLNEKI